MSMFFNLMMKIGGLATISLLDPSQIWLKTQPTRHKLQISWRWGLVGKPSAPAVGPKTIEMRIGRSGKIRVDLSDPLGATNEELA